jgi:hypothetical protein
VPNGEGRNGDNATKRVQPVITRTGATGTKGDRPRGLPCNRRATCREELFEDGSRSMYAAAGMRKSTFVEADETKKSCGKG